MITLFNLLAGELEGVPAGEISGPGPLGGEGGFADAPGLFENVISSIIGVLVAAAIIWFVFQFIIGAFSWIGSSGDPKAVEAARSRIYNALIGLVIALAAVAIISLIGTLLNIPILNVGRSICTISQQINPGIDCDGKGASDTDGGGSGVRIIPRPNIPQ